MRAVTVCVDYADLLRVTLPYNRHHFSGVLVVTSKADTETVEAALGCGADVYATDVFYARGAKFNKWAALEEGLDWYGREGWITLLDADVVLPKGLPAFPMVPGKLYSPLRRMTVNPSLPLPFEDEWKQFRLFEDHEFAGYCQMFHGSDPVLGPPPWHEVDWRHAGGGDSYFQMKWNPTDKVRPPFEVLHLGPSGANWCGRVTPKLDGTMPPTDVVRERVESLRRFVGSRRGVGAIRHRHEKI